MKEQIIVKPVWLRIFRSSSILGVALILLFGVPRFVVVLQANVTGNYNAVALIFLLMSITPFVFLTKTGRITVGMKRPASYVWLMFSIVLGAIACMLIFYLFKSLFGDSIRNPFVYISRSYRINFGELLDSEKTAYFLAYAIPAMLFSPIGEELFYRGVVHGTFIQKLKRGKAAIFDSLAFSVTHLCHFGFVYTSGKFVFLPVAALLWVACLSATCGLFFICKRNTESILGAVLCHAAFNFTMIYVIFYQL